jgi:hypothetical protein
MLESMRIIEVNFFQNLRTALLAFAFLLSGAPGYLVAQDAVQALQGLSDQELTILRNGKALIRQAASSQSLSLAVRGNFADEIRSRIRATGANYVAEVIMVVPAAAGSTTLKGLARDLSNVEGYVGIPYWSKQSNRFYDLFDRVTVIQRSTPGEGQTVVADQHMDPFADYRASYSCELSGFELRFHSENLSPISYKGFKAVAPGNMVWYLYGFPAEGATILYGVGAVRTFDMFGLFGERLKVSFMGRIQAFFSYMYGKSRQ